jgi:monothiol glutaredoxin
MDALEQKIREQIANNKVILYMKGSPDMPMCGFSARAVHILKECGTPFAFVNILEHADIRERLKQIANWPTYPQLYVKGELVGGCDIMTEMHEAGELKPLLEAA